MVTPSKKIQIEEIVKCGKDPLYFINHYLYIQHPTDGLVKFDTYDFQDKCIEDFLKHRYNIINKSRQLGISTISAAYCLWLAIFYKDKNILVIATQNAVAKNFIQKVKNMYKNLPNWLVIPKLVQDSTQAISFDNGSLIKAVPTNENAGRSEALSLLIVDEAAHIANMEELWLALKPTISTGGRAILLSSPKGVGNMFHKLWDEAQKGINGFNPIELPWHVHPDRDQAWYEKETRGMDSRGIAQEFNCNFSASGHSYLTEEDIVWIGANIERPIDRGGPKMAIWLWEMPKSGHKYIISADVCRGDSEDFSAFQIIDMQEDKIVGEFREKLFPDRFADLLNEMGRRYNDALICVELNTYGMMCSRRLKNELKYPNLYYEDLMKNPYGAQYTVSEDDETLPGFTMTAKTRPQVLAKFEEIVRNKRLRIYSSRLYEELKTFVFNNGKIQAQRGYNDDLVISAAIACWIYDVAEGYSKQSDGLGQAMLAGMSRSATVFHSQGWNGFKNGQEYGVPIMPMSFERKSNFDPSVQMANKLPSGVDKALAARNHMMYGAFGWVLDPIDKKS